MIVKFEDALLKHLKNNLKVSLSITIPKGRKEDGYAMVSITFKGAPVASSCCAIKPPKPI